MSIYHIWNSFIVNTIHILYILFRVFYCTIVNQTNQDNAKSMRIFLNNNQFLKIVPTSLGVNKLQMQSVLFSSVTKNAKIAFLYARFHIEI